LGAPFLPAAAQPTPFRRNRPGEAGWLSVERWEALNRQLRGRLIRVQSPLAACQAQDSDECRALLRRLRNPYYLGDEPALTQASGWADAWTSAPSAYAVLARDASDVSLAVNFAREHALRLVIRGGGHGYQGTSSAPDSLLIWTRQMNAIELHEAFVPQGCAAVPQPAVSAGAGAIWMHAYDAVTVRGGRYVQGGGCLTVGVAGLILGGGFGSFSKNFGTAAASLLEAEIVTADGTVRIANACTNPDLFWALKGGGAGSLGVVTRVTLRTHELPETVGAVQASIRATSEAAYRRLVGQFVAFCAERLISPNWGETVRFRPDNTLSISMLFQGIDQGRAEATWRPFQEWVSRERQDFMMASPFQVLAAPARRLWDVAWLKHVLPGILMADDRPGAPEGNAFWAANAEEAGQFIHGYESAWLPAALLAPDRQSQLADALLAASRHWPVALHFNKGLAGAPSQAIEAARDTSMNPAVLDAFALAISGAEGPAAYSGMPAPDLAAARRNASSVAAAMGELRRIAPGSGSYLAESNFFERDWQDAHWGPNYARLLRVKQAYDPDGLFFVHHGVGSEEWNADGFTRLR
jgi:FAD/FMN-containing dehydrogenase